MTTYTKLRDGSWGIRSTRPLSPGDLIEVVKKSGERKIEQVRRVIWKGDGVWLASIETRRSSSYSAPRRSRWESEDHEDCLTFGPCGPHCEYAHVFRR